MEFIVNGVAYIVCTIVATRWHYQRLSVELGPVAFDELVQLVRADGLAADDLVREEWNSQWRPAALAVGLFHMAGRLDLFEKWEAERREQEERAAARAAAEGEDPDEPAWRRRLREIEALQRSEREEDGLATATKIEIDQTVAAAIAEIEARERAMAPSRLQRWFGDLVSPQTLHWLFRWGVALAAPNLAAVAILSWSDLESRRYPNPKLLASGIREFPGWGACEPQMYFFLLIDAMLFAGFLGYVLARTLESFADD